MHAAAFGNVEILKLLLDAERMSTLETISMPQRSCGAPAIPRNRGY